MTRDDDDFRQEVDAHVGLETDRLIADGWAPDAARAAALRRFGNVTGARERFHESRRVMWIEDLRKDTGYALRSLRRNPGFAAVAILTLALGIGANTAIFSVVNGVLLRPLPYPGADRLVTIVENRPASEPFDGRPARRPPFGEDIQELARQTRVLSDVHVYGGAPEIPRPGREEEEGLPGARLSGEAMASLGARPFLGRLFAPGEVDQVIVLGYDAWRSSFGADPGVLGRTIALEQGNVPSMRRTEVYTVVGVMAPGFHFPDEATQYWMPRGGGLNIARLKPGITREAAEREVSSLLHRITGKLEIADAQRQGPPRFELVGLQDRMVAAVKPGLQLLGGAIALVLLIACVNVANLLLARATVRQREIAVRAAIGAGRGRLVRQLLTESVTLGVLGGAAGTGLALGGIALLRVLLATFNEVPFYLHQVGVNPVTGPPTFPRLEEIGLDTQAFLFALGLSIVTGVVFGLAPALRFTRQSRFEALRNASASSSGLRLTGRASARTILVVAEITMAMTLLVGGGLLIHGFTRLVTVDKGYDPSNVLTFRVRRPASRSSGLELTRFAEELTDAFRRVPGVQASSYAASLPMVSLRNKFDFRLSRDERLPDRDGSQGPTPPDMYGPDVRLVSRGYLDTLNIRMRAGRGFRDSDSESAPSVLIINDALARARFPERNPIGQVVFGPEDRPWEIIGVVADVRHRGADQLPEPQVFMEYRQWPLKGMMPFNPFFAVRTGDDPAGVVASLREVVRRHDPQAQLESVATLEALSAASLARPRTYAILLGIFAGIAVALAAIGIYGVVAYAVSQSTREIGIRLALGAESRSVLGMVIGQGARLAVLGIGIGLIVSVALTRYLRGMLFGIEPFDAPTFGAVAVLFGAIALVASYVPARRATRVSALESLRSE